MSLPAKTIKEVRAMTAEERTKYFETFARHLPDAPVNRYAIRVGSRTLTDWDTYNLRIKFNRLLSKKKVIDDQPINNPREHVA
jgi:hypothetical protein